MTQKLIDTVIFDFWGVLVKSTIKDLERNYGFDQLKREQRLKYLHVFHETDRGNMPTKELLKIIKESYHLEDSLSTIEDKLLRTRLLPCWSLAKKLSKKYKIIIFTNNQKSWPKKVGDRLQVDFLQFPILNSAKIGLYKPDPEFDVYLLQKFKLDPKRTIYVDDTAKNLVPANKLGIHTFHYQDNMGTLKTYLKKWNVIA